MSESQDSIVQEFIERISGVKSGIEEIYLFGSRSRDDWKPDSDYDILIVMEKKDRAVRNYLYDIVIDILISTGKLVSLKIFTTVEYNRLKSLSTPFISNVLKEGIRIGFNN